MTFEMKKAYLKEINAAKLVKEFVQGGGLDVEDAVDYVYDMKTLSREEFRQKYFK